MDYTQALRLADRLNLKVVEDLEEDCIAHGICVYWENMVRLKASLPEDKKLHVLIHEIAHATGTEDRLFRETLLKYDAQEIYALVEEAIVEASAVAVLSAFNELVYTAPLNRLTQECDEQGIEWEVDILPEVERIVNYLQPHLKEIVKNDSNV